ncbi:unnamed protein product [Calicophoron daubneyi]|uniref:Saposin B-type domain-containing protein n=1 Tax=Calicophoron daubneyi TaxID=300641 RepID=A0AAV2TGV8_CALDB
MNALFAVLFIVVATQATSDTNDKWCDLCKDCLQQVKEIIVAKGEDKDILAAIDKYCRKVLDVDGCKRYWRYYLPDLKEDGEDIDPELYCQRALQCQPQQPPQQIATD